MRKDPKIGSHDVKSLNRKTGRVEFETPEAMKLRRGARAAMAKWRREQGRPDVPRGVGGRTKIIG